MAATLLNVGNRDAVSEQHLRARRSRLHACADRTGICALATDVCVRFFALSESGARPLEEITLDNVADGPLKAMSFDAAGTSLLTVHDWCRYARIFSVPSV